MGRLLELSKKGSVANFDLHFQLHPTSGTVAKEIFVAEDLPFPTPNKKFYLFGATHPKFSSHQTIFKDTLFQETGDIQEADFLYVSVPHIDGKDQIDPDVFKGYVAAFKDIKVPMICTNPDRFAHEGNPPLAVVRQGSIAAMHEEQGGKVFYIGKPSDKMYLAAMNSFLDFGISDLKKILMVGDTPETDIRGARNFGISSALITKTGIMADRIAYQGMEAVLQSLHRNEIPDFLIEYMGKNEL